MGGSSVNLKPFLNTVEGSDTPLIISLQHRHYIYTGSVMLAHTSNGVTGVKHTELGKD